MRPQRPRPADDVIRKGFIQSYGLFWKANEVPWFRRESEVGEKYRLLGRLGTRPPRLQVCDFRQQRGIYVLYDEYGPYYVGLTRVGTLGNRLKQHRQDQHEEAWDRFSWFGFAPVLRRGRPTPTELSALGKVPGRLLTESMGDPRPRGAAYPVARNTASREYALREHSGERSSGSR